MNELLQKIIKLKKKFDDLKQIEKNPFSDVEITDIQNQIKQLKEKAEKGCHKMWLPAGYPKCEIYCGQNGTCEDCQKVIKICEEIING